jgi:hypothetical protein
MGESQTALFPRWLHLRVPKELPEAVRCAARRRHQTAAEWARQALLRAIAAESSGAPSKGEQPWRG